MRGSILTAHISRVFVVFLLTYLGALPRVFSLNKEVFSQDCLFGVLDSAWTLYSDHTYEPMADYLVRHLDLARHDDSIAMEYNYALTMAYGHLEWNDKMFESIVNGLLLAQKLQNRWMLLAFYRELGSFHDDPLGDEEMGLFYMKKALPYLDAVDSSSKCGLMN